MTISDRLQVGPYDVDTALRLIGPADFGILEPQGCCDYLVLIIQNIAVTILRVLNSSAGIINGTIITPHGILWIEYFEQSRVPSHESHLLVESWSSHRPFP